MDFVENIKEEIVFVFFGGGGSTGIFLGFPTSAITTSFSISELFRPAWIMAICSQILPKVISEKKTSTKLDLLRMRMKK